MAKADGFRVVAGEDHVVGYASSPRKRRCFCKKCGTHLFAFSDNRPGMVILCPGTPDADPGLKPSVRLWTKAKVPWHGILDDLPRLPEGFPKQ